jgi:hypothetical protein
MRKYHAPFWSSGRRSDPPIDCNTPSHQTTHLALHCCASYRIHLVTYVMMESRLRMEAKHQGGPVRTKLLPAAMERYGAIQQGLHAQG